MAKNAPHLHNEPPLKRVTQETVAKHVGVHRTTVSLALRNHPGIPEETRIRIRKIADQLGYAPDPMLASLVAYRNHIRTHAFKGTLAWLVNGIPPFDWRASFQDYYEGAQAKAIQYGYTIDVFDLHQMKIDGKRLASILSSRNINGILVAPQPNPRTKFDFAWEKFSAISFGHTLVDPRLHRVGPLQFQSVALTMQKLREFGYRRIGFFYTPEHNDRVASNYLAAYLTDEFQHNQCISIPPIRDLNEFMPWFKHNKPEVLIISSGIGHMQKLTKIGVRIPEDINVVFPFLPKRLEELSGVYENSFKVGAAGVDLLVAMIHRGERGVPETPQQILVDVEWNPGHTLRQMNQVA